MEDLSETFLRKVQYISNLRRPKLRLLVRPVNKIPVSAMVLNYR